MKQEVIEDLNNRDNSEKLGFSFGKKLIDSLYSLIFTSELEELSKLIKKNSDKILKSTDNLIELAYSESFKKHNYENVVKYVTNINKYCIELSFDYTNASVKTDLALKKSKVEENFTIFLTSCLGIVNPEIESKFFVHDFNDQILNITKIYSDLVLKFKETTVNSEILKLEEFKNGFRQSFKEEKDKFYNNKMKTFEHELKEKVIVERIKEIRSFLGCDSNCPGCGCKCNLQSGHDGNHKSSYHLFGSFYSWYYERAKIGKVCMTKFCWENDRYLKSVLIGNKNYDSLEIYIKECHKDWIENVQENYFKNGKNGSIGLTLKYKEDVIRAWMNTRKYFLNMFALNDRNDYDASWKNFEEKSMLMPNFELKWTYEDLKFV